MVFMNKVHFMKHTGFFVSFEVSCFQVTVLRLYSYVVFLEAQIQKLKVQQTIQRRNFTCCFSCAQTKRCAVICMKEMQTSASIHFIFDHQLLSYKRFCDLVHIRGFLSFVSDSVRMESSFRSTCVTQVMMMVMMIKC